MTHERERVPLLPTWEEVSATKRYTGKNGESPKRQNTNGTCFEGNYKVPLYDGHVAQLYGGLA